jgi:hypothetical protein
MKQVLYAIYPHDSVNESFVLRRTNDEELVVMDEYADLVCAKCRKVDERAAFSRGIQDGVVINSKRPFLASSDDFYVLDERAKCIFSAILPDVIDYFRIPSSRFYVASAKIWRQPVETDAGFRFVGGNCKECGRPREVVWGKVPPTLLGTNQFQAVNLESVLGARETWLVSKEVADELQRAVPPLTGMAIVPKDVEIGNHQEKHVDSHVCG